MVHRQEHRVVRVAQSEQADASERPAGQVEGVPRILDRPTLGLGFAMPGRQLGQIGLYRAISQGPAR